MQTKSPQIHIRISSDLQEKLNYIAADHTRTIMQEIEMLIKKHIAQYERQHGEITLDD